MIKTSSWQYCVSRLNIEWCFSPLIQGTDMTIASVGISVSSLHFCAQTFLRVLVQRGLALVKRKIHPTTVISGYRLAMKEAIKFIKKHMVLNTSDLGAIVVKQAAMVCVCELLKESVKNYASSNTAAVLL